MANLSFKGNFNFNFSFKPGHIFALFSFLLENSKECIATNSICHVLYPGREF